MSKSKCKYNCDKPYKAKGLCTYHYRKEWIKTAHGNTNSRTYKSWVSMKARCYNPNEINYKYYGGKGVTVCDEWKNSFTNFVRDLGERPEAKTLDRIDHDGNYEPGNVRWANKNEQAANRTTSTSHVGVQFDRFMGMWTARLTVDGEEMLPDAWFLRKEDAIRVRRLAVLKYVR